MYTRQIHNYYYPSLVIVFIKFWLFLLADTYHNIITLHKNVHRALPQFTAMYITACYPVHMHKVQGVKIICFVLVLHIGPLKSPGFDI